MLSVEPRPQASGKSLQIFGVRFASSARRRRSRRWWVRRSRAYDVLLVVSYRFVMLGCGWSPESNRKVRCDEMIIYNIMILHGLYGDRLKSLAVLKGLQLPLGQFSLGQPQPQSCQKCVRSPSEPSGNGVKIPRRWCVYWTGDVPSSTVSVARRVAPKNCPWSGA